MQSDNKIQNTVNEIDRGLGTIFNPNHLFFANNSVTPNKVVNDMTTITKNKKVVRDITSFPYKNIESLQKISRSTKLADGIYARLINYFGNLFTYDYLIYPKQVKGDMKKSYITAAKKLDRYRIKSNLGWIGEKVIEQGEIFLYKVDEGNTVVFFEVPSQCCRISHVEDGVLRYEVDLNKLKTKSIKDVLPNRLKDIVIMFENGLLPSHLIIENKWFQVDDYGVAFSTSVNSEHGVPLLSSLLDDLSHLEDIKSLQFEAAQVENLKLVHQKIPIDSDGEILFPLEVCSAYHNATKKNLPPSVAVTTNPLDLSIVNMSNGSTNHIANQVREAKANVFDSAGVNASIFSSEKNVTEAIKSSLITDKLLALFLIHSFEDYFNYELNKDNRTNNWKFKMLDTTHFNQQEKINTAKELLAYGGSRMNFLATIGYSPLESINILEGEQAIGFDKLLIPQLTSHTITGEDNLKDDENKIDENKTNEDIEESKEDIEE